MPIPALLAAVLPAVAPALAQRVVEVFTGSPDGGEVARRVTEAAVGVLGTDDPVAATQVLQDPVKLAELQQALAQVEKDLLLLDNEDRASARQQTVALAQAGSNIAWGAPVVSALIVVGFFIVMWRLFVITEDTPPNVFALLNMLFGALTIGFGQVCNYWLGSSAGSAAKDKLLRGR